MKESTVKLSGHSKDQFLERFFAAEPGLDAAIRQRLVTTTKAAFTSIRVRKATLSGLRPTSGKMNAAKLRRSATAPESKPAPTQPAPAAAPTVLPSSVSPVAAPPSEAVFDAYAIGLVPIFQREGRDGLLAKLAAVDSIDHLRRMAKAQQIVLPQPLRLGDAAPQAIRDGIADSVAKRIADRKAAAG